jgi:hypothetical protein
MKHNPRIEEIRNLENQQQFVAQKLFDMKHGKSGRGATQKGIALHQQELDKLTKQIADLRSQPWNTEDEHARYLEIREVAQSLLN